MAKFLTEVLFGRVFARMADGVVDQKYQLEQAFKADRQAKECVTVKARRGVICLAQRRKPRAYRLAGDRRLSRKRDPLRRKIVQVVTSGTWAVGTAASFCTFYSSERGLDSWPSSVNDKSRPALTIC